MKLAEGDEMSKLTVFDENVCVPSRLNPTRIPTVTRIPQDSTVRSPSAAAIL